MVAKTILFSKSLKYSNGQNNATKCPDDSQCINNVFMVDKPKQRLNLNKEQQPTCQNKRCDNMFQVPSIIILQEFKCL
uniref:Uncharacterized protein n=1 Tax=Arundo donax TaxID=35708 RepID=A0A0A8ZKH1_ARUDO